MAEAKDHVEALLKLSAEERSAAAEALLVSLEDEEELRNADQWPAEIERRIEENAPGIPAADVFSELRARRQGKK